MSLLKELDSVYNLYKSEINHISEFIGDADKSLTRKVNRKPKKELTKNNAEEFQAIVDAFNNVINSDSNSKGEQVTLNISNEVSEFIFNKMKPIKHKSYLSEMALSYLISHQEAFIKDYLFEILLNKKEMLRSGATITFEEVSKYSSMKALATSLAQKEVDGIGHGSIDDAAEYIRKKLNIELSGFEHWEKLREANYRRNILIHNRAMTNEIYCKKTGYKKRNTHLTTDNKYVLEIADIVSEVMSFLHNKTVTKFKLKKDLTKRSSSRKKRAGLGKKRRAS